MYCQRDIQTRLIALTHRSSSTHTLPSLLLHHHGLLPISASSHHGSASHHSLLAVTLLWVTSSISLLWISSTTVTLLLLVTPSTITTTVTLLLLTLWVLELVQESTETALFLLRRRRLLIRPVLTWVWGAILIIVGVRRTSLFALLFLGRSVVVSRRRSAWRWGIGSGSRSGGIISGTAEIDISKVT